MQHYLSSLLESVKKEITECKVIANDLDDIDSDCADNCRVDAGMLYGFQKILENIMAGKDTIEMISAELKDVTQWNVERRAE